MTDEIEVKEALQMRRDKFWGTQLKITERLQAKLFEGVDENPDNIIQLLKAIKLSMEIIQETRNNGIYPPL